MYLKDFFVRTGVYCFILKLVDITPSLWVYFRSNPFIIGTDDGGSIQYGYNFEILNTFEMGHLKKPCSHIPSRMDLSQTPGPRPPPWIGIFIIIL